MISVRRWAVLLCLVATACGSGISVSISDGGINGAPTAAVSIQQPAMPRGLPSAKIVKVVDGDTVDVQLNGQVSRVRLIGINTPETVDPRRPVECFGKEASDRAKALLSGQNVLLESDSSQQDRDVYDRLLRYIWFPDGRLFNLQMVVEGYAYEYTYSVPYKYQVQFKKAQQNAENQKLGLWSPQACNGKK